MASCDDESTSTDTHVYVRILLVGVNDVTDPLDVAGHAREDTGALLRVTPVNYTYILSVMPNQLV